MNRVDVVYMIWLLDTEWNLRRVDMVYMITYIVGYLDLIG